MKQYQFLRFFIRLLLLIISIVMITLSVGRFPLKLKNAFGPKPKASRMPASEEKEEEEFKCPREEHFFFNYYRESNSKHQSYRLGVTIPVKDKYVAKAETYTLERVRTNSLALGLEFSNERRILFIGAGARTYGDKETGLLKATLAFPARFGDFRLNYETSPFGRKINGIQVGYGFKDIPFGLTISHTDVGGGPDDAPTPIRSMGVFFFY